MSMVFNSCSASSGEVLTALKIRELASSGMAFKHVVREVEQFIYQMPDPFRIGIPGEFEKERSPN